MMNRKTINSYDTIATYIGIFMILDATILLLPLLVLIWFPEEISYASSFLVPALASALFGGLLISRRGEHLKSQQDAIVVILVWVVSALVASIPFLLSGQLNFSQAVFESVSGWTTTGLSVMDVSETPKIFLMHRTILQFFGGVGLVLVMFSTLTSTYGPKLYTAEGHSDKLLPNLAKSARSVLSIYVGYTFVGTILYKLAGMNWFDALNHAICAISTGGFSTKVDSIGAYNSLSIEAITILLMLLGTTNFAAHMLFINGKVRKTFRIGEIRFMFLVISVSIPLMYFFSLKSIDSNLATGLRTTTFQVVSALSTTGFSTTGYDNWPAFSVLLMILLMLIGGGTGSTAGGIKLNRVYVLMKSILWELRAKLMPRSTVTTNYVYRPEGKVYMESHDILEISNYAFLYMLLYLAGVLVMVQYGYPLKSALFEYASTIGTVGLSIGITNSQTPSPVLWIQSAGMLLGRLEIYVVFIALIKFCKDAKCLVVGRR